MKRRPKLRLWKLGSLEYRIIPTDKAIQRLQDKLNEWDGEGDLDLIWDDALKVEQLDLSTNDIEILLPHDVDIDDLVRSPKGGGPNIRLIRQQENKGAA